MAKVGPAGRMRPSNLFLRPLNPFLLFGKATYVVYKDQFGQKFFSKRLILFCFAEIVIFESVVLNSAARDEKLLLNLARDQKSLAYPVLFDINVKK